MDNKTTLVKITLMKNKTARIMVEIMTKLTSNEDKIILKMKIKSSSNKDQWIIKPHSSMITLMETARIISNHDDNII